MRCTFMRQEENPLTYRPEKARTRQIFPKSQLGAHDNNNARKLQRRMRKLRKEKGKHASMKRKVSGLCVAKDRIGNHYQGMFWEYKKC